MRLNLHFFEELLYSEEDRATKRAPSVPLTQRGTTKLPNLGLPGPSEPPATRVSRSTRCDMIEMMTLWIDTFSIEDVRHVIL